jgi:hypothetical protein
MPQIMAAAKTKLLSELAFRPDEAARYADYFAADGGCFPGELHTYFGLSPSEFARRTNLRMKLTADGQVAAWIPRERSSDDDEDEDDFSDDHIRELIAELDTWPDPE